jgi:hypothetical protein
MPVSNFIIPLNAGALTYRVVQPPSHSFVSEVKIESIIYQRRLEGETKKAKSAAILLVASSMQVNRRV